MSPLRLTTVVVPHCASPTTIGAHEQLTRPSGQAGSSCTCRGPVASPLSARLYNASDQIVFAAVSFHAASNLGTELLPETADDTLVVAITALVAAVLVTSSWRWMRKPAPQAPSRSRPDIATDHHGTA